MLFRALTYSAGLVKKYEEVSQKSDRGLLRVKIKRAVERRAVIARLQAANVTVREIDGKGLFAEVEKMDSIRCVVKPLAPGAAAGN